MPLAAQTVTTALVARVTGASTAMGSRFYSEHPQPFDESELPAGRLEIEEEPAEAVMLTGTIHQHKARVKVSLYVHNVSTPDATLNALVSQVLTALFTAPVPYALEIEGEIERTPVTEGQADIKRAVIPLRALYFVAASAPETILSA
jgi:hypothetical protein